jgi:Concanavalin A-like lectin/glucanases superfamily
MKPSRRCLPLFLPLLAVAAFAAPPPVTWTLNDLGKVGGETPTVWGTPQVVDGAAMHFNGASDGLLLPVNPLAGWDKFTAAILFRPESSAPFAQRFVHIQDEEGNRLTFETRVVAGKGWYMDTFLASGRTGTGAKAAPAAGTPAVPLSRALIDPAKLHPLDQWYWGEIVYDGHTMTAYVNGVQELTGSVALPPMGGGKTSLGVRQNKVYWFKGQIKEVRFYPAALAPADLPQAP